jgi:hypothetical protein
MPNKSKNPTPLLVRLGAASEKLGVTRENLLAGVLDGSVPMRIVRVSNMCFFRAAELEAFIRGEPAPAPDAPCYDLF